MREKVIDVAFSYAKLTPSIVFDVSSNRRLASSTKSQDYFTVKDSGYVFNAASSEMGNRSDTHVFGRHLESISRRLKGALFHLYFLSILSNSLCL